MASSCPTPDTPDQSQQYKRLDAAVQRYALKAGKTVTPDCELSLSEMLGLLQKDLEQCMKAALAAEEEARNRADPVAASRLLTEEQKKTARLQKELGEQALKHKAAMAQMEVERDAANNRAAALEAEAESLRAAELRAAERCAFLVGEKRGLYWALQHATARMLTNPGLEPADSPDGSEADLEAELEDLRLDRAQAGN